MNRGLQNTEAPQGRGVLRAIRAFFDYNRLGDILVLTGKLSAIQLREALALQKLSGQRLGQVLIRHRYIRRRELYMALFAQQGVRTFGAFMTLFVALSSFNPRAAKAQEQNLAGQFMLASARPDLGQIQGYPGLFGSTEKISSDTSAFTKWSGMFNRLEQDLSKNSNAAMLTVWKHNLEGMRDLPIEEMATRVNTLMNNVKYVRDSRNYGQSDYWATPIQFLRKGGDCEDYAIAKYVSLRALGVPENRMRVAVVHDRQQNTPHAILVVYTDTKALILDNQIKTVKTSDDIRHYRPIFSLNRTGWWLHSTPGTGNRTVLASAR
ncbi:MAG: transglutaminase-like cysteine peptidase [Pseudomonadota bacterium]